MGANHSHEDLELSDSDEYEEETEKEDEQEEDYHDAKDKSSERRPKTPSSVDEVEARLKALKLKYPSSTQNPNLKNPVKLYLHIGGNTPVAKWVLSNKLTSYSFIKSSQIEQQGDDEDEEEEEEQEGEDSWWVLKVGSKIRVRVTPEIQLKTFCDQRRVDFVANGVWAIKFFINDNEDYKGFVAKFQDC